MLPLLLPGMKPAALGLWFSREPLAVPVVLAPGKSDVGSTSDSV